MKLTREDVLSKWKVHRWPGSESYYVGPQHGRVAVASYKNKAEAKSALEMKEWLVKFLKHK